MSKTKITKKKLFDLLKPYPDDSEIMIYLDNGHRTEIIAIEYKTDFLSNEEPVIELVPQY